VVSALLLWWALRDVEWSSVGEALAGASLTPIVLGVVLATATFLVRLERWRVLLRASDGNPLARAPLWHAVAIGFMGNNVLPFRMGELMRCYAVTRLTGARFTAALSSVAVERVFDGLTVVALLVVGLFTAGLPPDVEVAGVAVSRIAAVSGLIMSAALVAGLLVVGFPVHAERLVRRLVPSNDLADRIVGMVEGIRHGLGVLRSPSRAMQVVAWSLVLWLLNAAAFWTMFAAFDIPVNFAGALVLQGVVVFGIAVPSTPGYVGVFEAAIKAVLLVFGIDGDRAIAYAVTYHVTTFLPIVALGGWSLLRTSLHLGELRNAPPA